MLTYLRYALATVCFAASVGCLALWWRSHTYRDVLSGPTQVFPSGEIRFGSAMGMCSVSTIPSVPVASKPWRYETMPYIKGELEGIKDFIETNGYFSSARYGNGLSVYFPLWYPALIFAFAGVANLRVSRFTIRSTIIATTIAAGLLGMAVVL
jgi:hypothetical protein